MLALCTKPDGVPYAPVPNPVPCDCEDSGPAVVVDTESVFLSSRSNEESYCGTGFRGVRRAVMETAPAEIERLTVVGIIGVRGYSSWGWVRVDERERAGEGKVGIERRSPRRRTEVSIEDRIRCACCSRL